MKMKMKCQSSRFNLVFYLELKSKALRCSPPSLFYLPHERRGQLVDPSIKCMSVCCNLRPGWVQVFALLEPPEYQLDRAAKPSQPVAWRGLGIDASSRMELTRAKSTILFIAVP